MRYAVVLINIKALGVKTFSYLIPDDMQDKIQIGQPVLVPFGRQGLYSYKYGEENMLQEATRAINSAFNNSFIKKLSQYLHDCVREEVKSSTFRNLKADRDNKWIFLDGEDKLFTEGLEYLRLEGSDYKLTELMTLSDASQKDKYLIY